MTSKDERMYERVVTFRTNDEQLLVDLKAALEALEPKELIAGALFESGSFCALGAVCMYRNFYAEDMGVDDDTVVLAKELRGSHRLIKQIVEINDLEIQYRGEHGTTNEEHASAINHLRWLRMSKWVDQQLANMVQRKEFLFEKLMQ